MKQSFFPSPCFVGFILGLRALSFFFSLSFNRSLTLAGFGKSVSSFSVYSRVPRRRRSDRYVWEKERKKTDFQSFVRRRRRGRKSRTLVCCCAPKKKNCALVYLEKARCEMSLIFDVFSSILRRKSSTMTTSSALPTPSPGCGGSTTHYMWSAGVALVLFLPVVVVATRRLRSQKQSDEDEHNDSIVDRKQ